MGHRGYEVQGVKADFDAELPYVIFDYYQDLAEAGECTKEEAMQMFLADIAMGDGDERLQR